MSAPTKDQQIENLRQMLTSEQIELAEKLATGVNPRTLALAFKLLKRCKSSTCGRLVNPGDDYCTQCKGFETTIKF